MWLASLKVLTYVKLDLKNALQIQFVKISIPLQGPDTPLTPTNGFDLESGQETVIPKVNELYRPHVQNVFNVFPEDVTQKD